MSHHYRPLCWTEDSPRAEPLLLPHTQHLQAGQVHWRLNSMLREYQRDGVRFLWDRLGRGAGGILCDDMGLGKTVQVIAFLSAVFSKVGDRQDREMIRALRMDERTTVPALIICPGSVLNNWEEELDRWGHFSYLKYHGQDRVSTLNQARDGRVEVVLTTFETSRDHCGELDKVAWQVTVVDECHKIKEKNSGITKALKSLSCQRRVGLTGTALQNKYEELWCLLDWANPGCLGSLEHFKTEFSLPMVKGFRQDATLNELSLARKKQEEFNSVKQHWMIRRTKASEIADQLPEKSDHVIFCGLSAFQREVFRFLLDLPQVKAVFSSLSRCPCGKKKPRHLCCERPGENEPSPQVLVLQMIHVFLKAANHAALLLPENTRSSAQAELGEEICMGVLQKFPELEDNNFLNLSNPRYSGKMEVLAGLLTILEGEGSKVLLFSYSTTLLSIIETFIQSKGYSYCRLDGSTKVGARQQMVSTFNKDKGTFLFLLSTKAGGLGLNITGANTVIIFDPNWNPSHDMQAQDRAYRLGQTREVRVFRLISAGCIEEIVYLRQLYKQQLAASSIDGCNAKRLFKAVQGDKKRKGELFGIKNLFRVSSNRSCLTEDIEKRHSDIENKILKKSRVALSVQNFELDESAIEDIGLEDDMDEDLQSGGVVYSHSNDQIVGGSKQEELISRLAMRSAGTSEGSKVAHDISCDAIDHDEEEESIHTDKYNPGETADLSRTIKTQGMKYVYGATPKENRETMVREIAQGLGLGKKEAARKILDMSWLEQMDLIRKLHSSDSEALKIIENMSNVFNNQRSVKELRDISYNGVVAPLEPQPRSTNTKLSSPKASHRVSPEPNKKILSTPVKVDKIHNTNPRVESNQRPPQKRVESPSFSSSSDDCQPVRPLKPAPEGIYFKKKRKTDVINCDDGVKEKSSVSCQLDEIFPDTKFDILKSDRSKKLKDVKKSKKTCVIVEDTIESIFG